MLETMFEQEKVQRGVRKGEERGERTFTTGTAEYSKFCYVKEAF